MTWGHQAAPDLSGPVAGSGKFGVGSVLRDKEIKRYVKIVNHLWKIWGV